MILMIVLIIGLMIHLFNIFGYGWLLYPSFMNICTIGNLKYGRYDIIDTPDMSNFMYYFTGIMVSISSTTLSIFFLE